MKGCRTSDHILTLKRLVDKAFKVSNCLYVCFIDFKKAFDSVNRDALLYKMCNSSSSLVTENHQRTDVYFPAVTIITEQNKNKT